MQDILNKKKLNQTDVKLLKGLFTKQRNEESPKKSIHETFKQESEVDDDERQVIVRKFKSFVLRESVDNASRMR